MADENSTAWIIEQVLIETFKANITRTQNFDHFHSDEVNGWPLVSVKATLREEDQSLIYMTGHPVEIHNVMVVAEWPITAETEGALISAAQIDLLARDIRAAIPLCASADAMDRLVYFEINPLTDGAQDIEQDESETPTRRVDIIAFEVIATRS